MQGLFFLSQKIARFSAAFLLATALAVLAGCSPGTTPSSSTTTPPAPTGTAPVATIQMSGTPTTIFSDNSNSTTITLNAIDANNASISGATITLSTTTGQLSSSTLITDAAGKATATFSSGLGFANQANRTATITATSGTATALLTVQITGSTLTLLTSPSSLSSSGTPTGTLTINAKDKGGNPISGTTVTLTQSGIGRVTLTPATGTTDASGQLVVTVAGATTVGTVTVSAAAAGVTATTGITVGAVATTFGINLLTLNGGTGVVPVNPKTTAMHISDTLAVQVAAPASTSVVFSTTIGTWAGANPLTPNYIIVTPSGGVATATLSSTTAGLANVEVLDILGSPSDSMTVGITASVAASIQLQASPTVVPKSVGSTVGHSNLTALVLDSTGAPVGGALVAFSIVSGTGTSSGENISPVVVASASTTAGGQPLGTATATFTSGTLSSGAAGIQVRASVVGTAIATQPIPDPVTGLPVNATTSSLDAAIVIGGTAGSVAFGLATKIIDAQGTSTTYSFPMSVLVADSNGSPAPLGTVVNISTWPIAWSTGLPCSIDADDGATKGTFYNEDVNQNLVLDSGEDGTRKYFFTGATGPTGTGTKDGQITPLNSYGGTIVSTNSADLPGTATTDATGLATFNLTYTKSSALWIIARIRAQALVQGSPSVGQLDWRLEASATDDSPGICFLPPSPFKF
jgi:Bacterial Ig-like domain (group 1)